MEKEQKTGNRLIKKRKKQYPFWMEVHTLQILRDYCDEIGIYVSQYVRQSIREKMKRDGLKIK